jgi:hypothetical protein
VSPASTVVNVETLHRVELSSVTRRVSCRLSSATALRRWLSWEEMVDGPPEAGADRRDERTPSMVQTTPIFRLVSPQFGPPLVEPIQGWWNGVAWARLDLVVWLDAPDAVVCP